MAILYPQIFTFPVFRTCSLATNQTNMPDFKTQIRDFIAIGKLDEALDLAKTKALSGLTELDTPATLLSSEFEYLKRSAINGILSAQEETTHRQNIAFRLLSVVDDLPEASVTAPDPTTIPKAKTTLLFLGANPFQNLALELEREIKEVSDGLQQFGKREQFDFRAKIHVTPTDLQRMLLGSDYTARFVHFAGNAVENHPQYGSGILFEDEHGSPRTVPGNVLAMIFRQFPGVECVFLNTCDSGPSALAIGQYVPYAIGMNARIYDESAIIFAVAFYEAIAGGNDVKFAFEFARTRLLMERYPDQASIPVLIVNGKCDDVVYVPGDSHLTEDCMPRVVR